MILFYLFVQSIIPNWLARLSSSSSNRCFFVSNTMIMKFFSFVFCFFFIETQLENVNEFNRNLNYVNIGQLKQSPIVGVGVGGQVEQVCAYNIDNDSHFHGHQLYCKFQFLVFFPFEIGSNFFLFFAFFNVTFSINKIHFYLIFQPFRLNTNQNKIIHSTTTKTT